MRQILLRVIAVAITFASALPIPAQAQIAQTPIQKALVYCPVAIDGSGCDHIVTALSGAFASVDRAYDGTNGTIDLTTADLNHYAVFVVPSLADGAAKPFALLRDATVAARLKTVVTGRIAVWSGTPDQGDVNRALKDRLIQNLASWASQPYTTNGVTGTVILQDFSADATQRYGWLSGISAIAVTADTSLDVYDSVAVLTPAGKTVLDNGGVQLAYGSMASYGLHLPNGNTPLAGALGGSSNRQIVLATYDGATDGIASVMTDKGDYVPGDTATITGSGWAPGETVSMVLHEDPEVHDNRTLTSVADGQGNFINRTLILETHDFGVKFLLTAAGETSGRSAQTIFTDGGQTLALATSGTAIPSAQLSNFPWSVNWSAYTGTGNTPNLTCSGTPGTNTANYTGNSFSSGSAPTAGNQSSLQLTAISATGAFASQYAFDYWSTSATSTVPATPGCIAGTNTSAIYYAHFKAIQQPSNLSVGAVSGTYGNSTVSLTATLTSNSSGVSGKTINFTLSGNPVGTATTNSSGVATLNNVSLSGISAGSYTSGVSASFGGDGGYLGSSGNAALTIAQASTQTSITAHTPDPASVGQLLTISVTVASPTADPPAGSVAVALIGASGDRADCNATLTKGAGSCTVTPTAVGSKTLLATFPGNANYHENTTSITVQVGQASQTISFAALPNQTLGAAPFALTATASSGLPVTFAVGATDQCTISGSTLTLTAAGSCTVTASQAGDATYAPAATVSQTFTIAKGQAAIAITGDTPAPSQFGQPVVVAFTVTAAAGLPTPSGNVTISDGSANCTATVAVGSCSYTPTSAGTKTLTATYGGDANFAGGVSAGQTHQVNKAPVQTLITAHTPDPVPLGQQLTVTVSATSTTAPPPGGSVSVSLHGTTQADNATCNATLTNGVGSCALTPPTAGSRTLQATFPGDANYNENTSPAVTQQVGQAPQTITFAALPNKSFGDVPFTVSATATSGLPVSFAVGATDQCTISGNAVSLTGAGSCTVTASQAGDATYQQAPNVSQTFQIAKATSSVAISSHTPNPSQVGQAVAVAYAVTGVGGGTGATGNVSISDGVASCTATVAAGTCSLTATSAGPKTLTASYAGDNNYQGSVSAGVSHQVNQASQTITFAALPNKKVTDPPFAVTATASSGLPVSFAVGATDQCTISSSTVTITGAGSCTVTASQAGNKDVAAAPSVSQTFTITKAQATVAITADTPDPSQYGQAVNVAFTVSGAVGAPSPTGNVTVADGNASCTATVAIGSCALPLTTVGSRILIATYGGDANFENSASAGEPHQVNKAAVQTTITAHTPEPATVGQAVTVAVSVTSLTAPPPGGSVAVSLHGTTQADNATCNATLTNGVGSCALTPPTAGSRTLQATFPGDGNYGENSSPIVTATVNKATAIVTLVASTLNQTYDGAAKSVQATTSVSGLAVAINYSQNGVPVTAPIAAGNYDVTASVQDANYSGSATGTLVIGKATATLTIADVNHPYNGTPQGVTVTTSPSGLAGVSVSYAGAASAPTDAGSYAVSATLDNPNYIASPASATLTIAKVSATITLSNLEQTYDGKEKVPTVSTTPPNLHFILVFGEGATSNSNPVNAGSYPFVATIDDKNYEGSANGMLVIAKATATLSLSNLNQSYDGSAKAPTVTVTPAGVSGVALTYNGSATPPVAVGSYAVVASLNNTNYAATAISGTLVIGKAATTTTITSQTPSPSSYGEPITVAVNVGSVGGAIQGTVTISDGTASCSATVGADGLARCALTPTSVGTKTLIATYGGDDNHAGSVSAGVGHDVTKAAVQTMITSHTPDPSVYGQAITISVAVNSLTGTPTGAVAVSIVFDGVTCNATLTNGAGSCSLIPQSAGNKSISATFPGDANFNENTSAPVSHTVNKATASVTFDQLSQTYNGAPRIVTATTAPANITGLAITYDGSATPPVNAGTYTVGATLDNQNYMLAPASATLTVSPGGQSITFAPLSSKTYGDASFRVTATASSGLPVAFRAAGQCTVVASQVTLTGAGGCTITASQDGGGNFAAAADVTQTFSIAKATLTSSANSAQLVYGDVVPSLSGTLMGVLDGDGITGTFTTTATAASPVGSYPIAPQLQDPNGKLANYTVVLTNGTLTITRAPLSATANDATRVYGTANPTFTGTISGLRNNDAITLSFSTTATSQSNAGTYSIVPVLVDPDRKLGNYAPSLANGTLTINKASQTITFTAPPTAVYGDPSFTVTPIATSGLAVTVAASGPCSISGGMVTLSGAGNCTLTASQAGNDNYSAALEVKQTIEVRNPVPVLAPQPLQPASLAVGSGATTATISGSGFAPGSTVRLNGSTDLPTTFVSGTQLTATIPATATATSQTLYLTVVNGTPGGGTSVAAALFVLDNQVNVTASATQTSTDASGTARASVAGLTASATGTGTVAVAQLASNPDAATPLPSTGRYYDLAIANGYSFTSLTATFCDLNGGGSLYYWSGATWQLVSPQNDPDSNGCLSITFTESTVPSLSALVRTPFAITKKSQTITFGPLANKAYGDLPFVVSATTTSGLPVSFSVGASDQCTISGSTVTIVGVGSCTVTAAQGGGGRYAAAQSVQQTFTISKGSASLTLGNLNQTYDGSPKAVTVTVSPVGVTGVSVTYDGSATPPTNAGQYSVSATLTNGNYTAQPATGTLVIGKSGQIIAFSQPSPLIIGSSASIAGSASSSAGLPLTYTTATPDRCSVTADGTVSVIDVGVGAYGCAITASQAGNANYNAATATTTIDLLNKVDAIINNANNTLSWSSTTTYFTVAILTVKRADGTILFDASRVDPAKVTITSPRGTTGVMVDSKGQLKMAMIDVNLDGAPDLVLYFTKNAIFGSGDVGQPPVGVTLNGTLKSDGRLIRGNDKIQITQ